MIPVSLKAFASRLISHWVKKFWGPIMLGYSMYEVFRPTGWPATELVPPILLNLALCFSVLLASYHTFREVFAYSPDAGTPYGYLTISSAVKMAYIYLPKPQKLMFFAAERVDNTLLIETLTKTVLTSCAREDCLPIYRKTIVGLQEISFEIANDLGLVHGCHLDDSILIKKNKIKSALKKYYKSKNLKLSRFGNRVLQTD